MKTIVSFLVLLFCAATAVQSQQERQIVDLRGNWKFEIGDDLRFADPKFDDSAWDEIFVPADWENEGFPGYDGYGWYRKKFTLPASARSQDVYLRIVVDDVCAVYVNGQIVGVGGSFPPDFETAYNVEHKFFIPKQFLRYNEQNSIAVRVYDDYLNGGIVKGRIGIFTQENAFPFVVTFPELWKFKKGDNEQWSDPSLDDTKWQTLIVPAPWDFQGYGSYDGFGWYRVTFTVPSNLKDDDLVALLGRIDDIDETYVNGELIGKTGRIRSDGNPGRIREEYREFRFYSIPKSLLRKGEKNVLAVRVYDTFKIGGIYEGPVGIARLSDVRRFKKQIESNQWPENTFLRLIDKIFSE
ncbi:MAG: sugar-binding domain-containing protein [Bacteroidota bacterium]